MSGAEQPAGHGHADSAHLAANHDERRLEDGTDHTSAGKELQETQPRRSAWGINDEVSLERVDIVPLTCAFISGLVDSTVFNAFGTFVSMQTGNTIFVALGASGQNTEPYGWAKSLMAVVCFMLGALVFSRYTRHLGHQRRGSLASSFAAQAMLVLIAAAITQSGAIDGHVPSDSSHAIQWSSLAPIALLSFQSAGQIIEARNLGINEVPTVVITSLLCDLWSDPGLLAPFSANVKRNRRVVAFVLTVVGGIAGGWISKASRGVSAVLWIVAGLKAVIAVAWVFWPRRTEKKKA